MRSKAGYTLMEMLVVLTILGFVSAAALPMLSASRPGLRAKAAARAVASDFGAARQEAILKGEEARVTFDPASSSYALPGGARRVLPQGIALSAQQREIDFFPDGSSSGGSVTVTSGATRHRVTARWPSGQIVLDE
ncbi:MAG TPA: type II secretion system protein [Rhizomicrobium sp.]|jgi:general secretion pathway protein H